MTAILTVAMINNIMEPVTEIKSLLKGKKIAYFSMEIGLEQIFSTYSGGLGILAGDTIRSCADLNIPFVAVTLVSKKGFFQQELTAHGKQIEHPDVWNPEKFLTQLPITVEVEIEKQPVKIKAWAYIVKSTTGGKIPVLFLDTDNEENTPENRAITDCLYGGDRSYRLKQEIILGIGGVKILNSLGVDVVKYHLNEGHASLLVLELLDLFKMDEEKVRRKCVFTTHTPIAAGHDKFSYEVAEKILPSSIPLEIVKKFAGTEELNMSVLAMNLSNFVNGVAKRHGEVTKKMFPGYEIRAITNGVHPYTWTHSAFRKIYDTYLPGWANEPELLVRAEIISRDEVLKAHSEAKKELIDFVNHSKETNLNHTTFTIGFARRATAYKRHTLIFSDLDRLKSIHKKHKIQIIFAGKAHPHDDSGKKIIEEVFSYIERLKNDIDIVYLEDYDMEIAKKLIPGVDVWLNTPQRPMEASGTSGMKAAYNGVINFSVLDGWWLEGCIEGVTGWAIGPSPDDILTPEEVSAQERNDIYGKLEYTILPLFYNRRDIWAWVMQNSIGKIAYYFNTHRMIRRYMSEAYFI